MAGRSNRSRCPRKKLASAVRHGGTAPGPLPVAGAARAGAGDSGDWSDTSHLGSTAQAPGPDGECDDEQGQDADVTPVATEVAGRERRSGAAEEPAHQAAEEAVLAAERERPDPAEREAGPE